MIYRLAQIFFWLPFKIFCPTKVIGRKNMPKGAAILSCNHTSNLDAVLIVLNTYEKKHFLTKKELFKNSFISFLLKGMKCIKIDRSKSGITAIKNSLKVLKDGKKLAIFPEGTRNKGQQDEQLEIGEVKQGVSMFALKAQVPIVPVILNRRPRLFRRTIIAIGQPFTLEEYYGQKLGAEVLDEASALVSQKMHQLQEEVNEKYGKKKSKKEA